MQVIRDRHYTQSVPSGKSYVMTKDGAIVMFSIPANPYLERFMLKDVPGRLWELSRLWAEDGHEPNLLTKAIGATTKLLRSVEPECVGLVSFADPNAGHSGGVYRAASWVYTGQSAEARVYQGSGGEIVPRRKFHSGNRSLKKAEIEALGYREIKRPGKHRFFKGFTRQARRLWADS